MKVILILITAVIIAAALIGGNKGNTYELHRTSTVISDLVYIASFDADEKDNYNYDNCMIAKKLFESQPGVTVMYMCLHK